MTRFSTFPLLLTHVLAWPVDSQQGSRRNAMVACTQLAQLRAEREDVEEFLAAAVARTVARAEPEPLVRASP